MITDVSFPGEVPPGVGEGVVKGRDQSLMKEKGSPEKAPGTA